MLQQARHIGLTILSVISISSGVSVGVAPSSQAVTVPPRCPVASPDKPRPRDCTITSHPEAFSKVGEEEGQENPDLYRGSGRRDKGRDATKPYHPEDRGAPEGTIGSGTR